jgi:DNA-binding response OmpR family regulator
MIVSTPHAKTSQGARTRKSNPLISSGRPAVPEGRGAPCVGRAGQCCLLEGCGVLLQSTASPGTFHAAHVVAVWSYGYGQPRSLVLARLASPAGEEGPVVATTVLLVEDERKLRELVRSYLERGGFTVLSASSGAEALSLAGSTVPDLVVLDLGLPDVPGEAVARELRAGGPIPILMLTAKAAEEDRIRGLELGADDYVTKPFSPRELVLRCQAILRRGGQPAGAAYQPASYGEGALMIDEERRSVQVRGQEISLTPTEWGVLLALATVPGRVYSRYEIINRTRGYEFEGYERSVDSHVKNLRRKIEADAAQPEIIQTVLGGGYRLGLGRDG